MYSEDLLWLIESSMTDEVATNVPSRPCTSRGQQRELLTPSARVSPHTNAMALIVDKHRPKSLDALTYHPELSDSSIRPGRPMPTDISADGGTSKSGRLGRVDTGHCGTLKKFAGGDVVTQTLLSGAMYCWHGNKRRMGAGREQWRAADARRRPRKRTHGRPRKLGHGDVMMRGRGPSEGQLMIEAHVDAGKGVFAPVRPYGHPHLHLHQPPTTATRRASGTEGHSVLAIQMHTAASCAMLQF
ncbi:predicted protein [Verticillium alfalfae VaMs.102]|uniref:Predicted protein n=1 Tax=Verticillium alfalfae (strain VaMs.102 / ATCC MYA-4576 / FGSC 10136) TaxID=526221 RepID=C9SKT0_VERA1|nr:predicted protein [Verticillium alfalfae VaMs.102]EEY19298.1 predicted protein [Verticillium alfalfae VaMs.102]